MVIDIINIKKWRKSMKKKIFISGMMLALFMAAPAVNNNAIDSLVGVETSYAAELSQSARWVGTGDRWQVSDNVGGFIKNCWFQDDVTGHWYLLGAEDGSVMYAGLVTDNSTGKTYLLNPNHDGTYGRMISVNGSYNLNGKSVYLTFNQTHDGTFGAITSGLSEARSSGIAESRRDSIPTDSGVTSTQKSQTTTSSQSNGGSGSPRVTDISQWMTGADETNTWWDSETAKKAEEAAQHIVR